MADKKVLILTYYWPPSGGSAVLRWLKFSKYLQKFGWKPIIYTVENGEFPEFDPSNEKDIPEGIEVIRTKITEPYNFYKFFIGQKKEQKINVGFTSANKKPKKMERLSRWIRGNLFIPDARKFWIKPSVRYLNSYLENNPVDVIISSGPPHSLHLIGLNLKQKLNIPWVADFRDPWTNIDYYKELLLTKRSDKKHHKLEKQVLGSADMVISIGKTMKDEFDAIGAKNVEVITNGYDEDDIGNDNLELDSKFSICHVGTINAARNPKNLWNVLSDITNENPEIANNLSIKLIGTIDAVTMSSIEHYGLSKYLEKIDYLPHKKVMSEMKKSQLLLLLINNTQNAKGILTGKFFEYLGSKRPILAIGPTNGDVATIMHETEAGNIVPFNNKIELKELIIKNYKLFTQNNLEVMSKKTIQYSRKELTKHLVVLLNKLI